VNRTLVRLLALTALLIVGVVGLASVPSAPADRGSESPVLAFPSDSGVVDVKAEYGARGDGRTDDTAAIRRAIRDHLGTGATLYFPRGTYLVSGSLEWRDAAGAWGTRLAFVGQDRDGTVIRLEDGAEGFGDVGGPRAVIYTGSSLFVQRPYGGGKDYPGLGEGNEAFGNYVENLTVDTGARNRGAVGIDYLGSNYGAIRGVTVRGEGVAGLSLQRRWPGPAWIQDIRIEGFDHGIVVSHREYGITLEHVELADQRVAGILNRGNVLSIRGLRSENSVPVVHNTHPEGLVTLVDGSFRGGARSASAIVNSGGLLARNVSAPGYRSAVENSGAVVPGTSVKEFVSGPPHAAFPGPQATLGLPVKEPPPTLREDPSRWANVADFGAVAGDWGDDTDAIRAALESGRSTVYLPLGRYLVRGTLEVPGTVRRIVGMGSTLAPARGAFANAPRAEPLFAFEEGREPLVVERLSVTKLVRSSPSRGLVGFGHSAPRTVVLRDVRCCGEEYLGAYRAWDGAGPLFVENVAGSGWRFAPSQKVWARQLNPEDDRTRVVNDGADLWVLGIKTEGPGTVIETTNGGRTELLGGLLYPAGRVPAAHRAFVSRDSEVSLTYAMRAYEERNGYRIHVEERRGATERTWAGPRVEGEGPGAVVPLYSGRG